MSRAMNVDLSLDEVTKACNTANVAISAIEVLPSGNTHLVCVTSEGAETIRHSLRKAIVPGKQRRFATNVPQSRW